MSEPRQFLSCQFFRVDPAWRRLPQDERRQHKAEFLEAYQRYEKTLILLSYSTVGLKAETDFLIWRVSESLEFLQEMSAKVNGTKLAGYLATPYTYLSMTKRSMYIDKHQHPGQERTKVEVPKTKYLFVYPFVKTREWHRLPQEARQQAMDEHIAIGHQYPSVRIHTSYSFGLDDQEFMVLFDTDSPHDFLDLVMALRGTEASRYTLRDTPIFTCVAKPMPEILDQLDGQQNRDVSNFE